MATCGVPRTGPQGREWVTLVPRSPTAAAAPASGMYQCGRSPSEKFSFTAVWYNRGELDESQANPRVE